VGFIVCWLALMPTRALPLLALLGAVVGGEAAVTARSLGLPVTPRVWIRRFAGSWVHLGFLTGVLVMIAMDPNRATVYAAAGIMLVAYSSLLLAVAVAKWVDIALSDITRRADLRLERYAEAEDRRRSHWLHDDVLGMLTGVQMKLEREQWDSATTAGELRWLDHQLRLRQTEEIVRSGTATIGEVVQPYLRHAQNLGVTVTEVPSWEIASMRLNQGDARRLQRVFGVAVPNALAAGAATLAIRCEMNDRGRLAVEVEDDAGGFDTSRRIPGRGLDVLDRELPGAVLLVPTGVGTILRAELAVEAR
jgi:signal transduction histidine kinase